MGVAFVSFVWLVSPERFLAAVVALAALPLAARALVRGRWSADLPGVAEVTATAFLVVYYAVLAAVAGARGLEAIRAQESHGVVPAEASAWLVIAAVGLAALGMLVALSMVPVSRRLHVAVTAVAAAGALAAAGLATAVAAGPDRCERFRFDPAIWRATLDATAGIDEPRERMADALVACRTLRGARRAEVARLLGKPTSRTGTRWGWFVGEDYDLLGPGDARFLVVSFGRDGRVREAS